jgi:hypothetical protein
MGRRLSLTVGDILVYLNNQSGNDRSGAIRDLVTVALKAAADDPGYSIVVAHSMGGNIVYDILSSYHKEIEVDLLVTVGSQVGLFEELKLFHASDGNIPSETNARVATPPNIRHWMNIVDRADVLSFAAEPIFDRTIDYDYPSAAAWAHGAYFKQPNFHARLARRATEILS